MQGVAVVYPHTSNWDAVVMFLAKWTCGVQVMFWAKDKLFDWPVVGHWLRWIGGVPVQRTTKAGVVSQAVDILQQHKSAGHYFWIGLAPEGTRKFIPGWRSGFYQTALAAQVPLCLVKLDYARREVSVKDFLLLSGNEVQDMARIAAVYDGVRGGYIGVGIDEFGNFTNGATTVAGITAAGDNTATGGGFSPSSSSRKPHAILWLNGASMIALTTSGDESASPTPSRPLSVRIRTMTES